MKVIAFYLPQFHRIPENDEWWGDGFTEWVNVKKAKPLFEGHIQPRIPLNNNYYDLSNVEVIKKQANMAMEYGINAFCFYHYWFDGHKLLEKPVEAFLDKTDIDIEYCLSWANEHWTNGWVSSQENVLIEQRYGGKKEWKEHFDYLLPFFQDKRYIKEDNKPFFIIYRPEIIDCLNEMLDYWNELAKEAGFSGMCYAYQFVKFDLLDHKDDSRFTYDIEYQPIYAMQFHVSKYYDFERKVKRIIDKLHINIKVPSKKVRTRDYDDMWQYIINSEPISNKSIPGAFVNWDNTPRNLKVV